MEKELEKINEKLDKLTDDIVDVKVILAKQEENIKHHIKRTDLLEENVEILRDEMRKDLRPIKKHVQSVGNLLKFVGATGALLLFLKEIGIFFKILSIF